MLGDNIRISKNLILVEGMIPRSILIEPDIANVLVYKKDNTLFLFDTGATLRMRKSIHKAIETLMPFDRFVLLNSHAHPDHTANNAIINEVNAKEKKHYISKPGIAMMNYNSYFLDKYKTINKYYSYLDGPRFPISIATKIMKVLEKNNKKFEYFMVHKSLKKFEPFDTSSDTACTFESLPHQNFDDFHNNWSGWYLYDCLYALESRGHSPDSISFFLPDEKLIMLSDETFPFFNCWPDSNGHNIEKTINLVIQMVKNGQIETLINGHEHKVFQGKSIVNFLETLLSDYQYFKKTILDIVMEHENGITINQIYSRLCIKRKHPVLAKYFALEFPKMPPMLKTVITSLLLETNLRYSGQDGNIQFFADI